MNTPEEFRKLESSLRSLMPAAAMVNRDQLMYEAGRAAARQAARPWQAMTGLLLVALIGAVIVPLMTESPDRVAGAERSVPQVPTMELGHAKPLPQTPETTGMLVYVDLRRRVLQEGVDALPTTSAQHSPAEPLDRRELQRLLEKTL